MNIYEVINYFQLQSFAVNNGKGGMNQEILISGKVRKSSLLLFFLLTGCFVLADLAEITFVVENRNHLLPLFLDICAYILVFIEHKVLFLRLEKNSKIDYYQRQLPSNLKPAHVRMLMNDGLIDKISVASTLMDLIDKGYLKIEGHEHDNDFFKYDDSVMLVKTNKDTKDLLKYEDYLIDWFINVCGDGKKVSKGELHDRLDDIDATTSNDRYNNFKAYTIVSYPFYKLYKNHLKMHNFKAYLVLIMILISACVIPFFSFFSFIGLGVLPIIAFGILLFNNPAYTLNNNGSIEYGNWMALKKFLNEFTLIKERTAEMLVLWSFYLTYSVALEENKIAKDAIVDFFGTNIHVGNDATSANSNSKYYQMKLSDKKKDKIENVIEEEKAKYKYESPFLK